ncbi:MAG: TadG family pilus assembly protein, partial [Pyrinomonadaceae bacterium]
VFRNRLTSVATSAQEATANNSFTNGSAGVTVAVNNPPASGYYAGDTRFVEVIVTQDTPSYFIRVFGINSAPVRARAVAGVGARSKSCIYALDPAEEKALTITSQSRLTANCGVIDNSRAYNAFNVESGSTVSATNIFVTGGSNVTSASTASPAPKTSVPPEPDPLGYLQPPTYGGFNYNNYKASSATVTLNPGVYCGGLTLASGSKATLNPGLYVLNGGGLQVQSGSTIKGTGVTFFNTGSSSNYQPVRLESGSSADLAAPTSGYFAGILFFQNRNVGKTTDMNLIQSNIQAKFQGALYFPTQILALATSNSAASLNGGVIVARTIMIESGSQVTVNNNFAGGPGSTPLKRMSLVE